MTTRTPEQIEAGAREYVWPSRAFSAEEQDTLWLRMSESDRRHYLDRFRDVLSAADAAADAVAAPAVGVSELNEAIEKVRHAARVAGATGYDWAISAERSACQDLFALLTAQPEPGTHDDAGQATEGGEG